MSVVSKERLKWGLSTAATVLGDHLMRQHLVGFVVAHELDMFGLDHDSALLVSVLCLVFPLIVVTPCGAWLGRRLSKRGVRSLLQGAALVDMVVIGAFMGLMSSHNKGSAALLAGLLLIKGMSSALFGVLKFALLSGSGDDTSALRLQSTLESASLVGIFSGTLLGVWLSPEMGGVAVSMYASVAVFSLLGRAWAMRDDGELASSEVQASRRSLSQREPSFLEPLRKEESVFLSALGVGWFWALGAACFVLILEWSAGMGSEARETLACFFASLAVGLGAGFGVCRLLARDRIELGLIPFASMGISITCLIVFGIGIGAQDALASRLPLLYGTLFALAMFGGIFIVPLQSFIHTTAIWRSRQLSVIAGTNWLSAVMMCVSAASVMLLLDRGIGSFWIMGMFGVMNLVVMWFVYQQLPRFVWAFMVWVLTRVMYRFRMIHREKIPLEGAALISCNHPSYIDFMFVAAALSHRPPRFIMHHTFFKKPVIGWLFRDLDVIPIAPKSEDEALMQEAFDEIARSLEEGELVCIFPEGLVTYDGKLNAFRPGIERIVERTPVPVIPLALKGLWGSAFSRAAKGDKAARANYPRFRAPIELEVGDAIPAEGFDAHRLGVLTARMGGWEDPPEVNSERDRAMQKKTKGEEDDTGGS